MPKLNKDVTAILVDAVRDLLPARDLLLGVDAGVS